MRNAQTDPPVIPLARNIVAGEHYGPLAKRNVSSPFSGKPVSEVADADPALVDHAISTGVKGAAIMAATPEHQRHQMLSLAADLIRIRAEAIANMMCLETGKAIRDCRTELDRAYDVTGLCAAESVRITGRHVPLGASAAGHGKLAYSARFPVGLVAGIVPFNAPVNLTCHKIAPALAAGNSIIIKAPPQAPMTLDLLICAYLDAGVPPEAIGLIHGGAEIGEALIRDPRVGFLSFTGSQTAGLAVKKAAGTRGCILELGGVGPTIVHRDADVELAAKTVAATGFRLAGQSCASVQNLFVHADVVGRFTELLLGHVSDLKFGDPLDPDTDLGPVIDDKSAERIDATVRDAVAAGAKCLIGGARDGRLIAPVVLTDVSPQMDVVRKEIFGPVVVVRPYEDIKDPINWIAGTGQGINCGLFTDSHAVIQQAFQTLPAAAVIVNKTSTFRPDQLPYGGIRDSGYGRECPADTVRAMTVERFLVIG